jgi:8-oxo-dGTP diphosphatase
MTDKNKTIFVVAAALIKHDTILLVERPKGKPYAGYWELPGGKIEPNETPQAALVRELKEEIGIMVHDDILVPVTFLSHTYPQYHAVVCIFACEQWEGTPMGCEGQEIAWVSLEQMGTKMLLPSNIELTEKLPYFLKYAHSGFKRRGSNFQNAIVLNG